MLGVSNVFTLFKQTNVTAAVTCCHWKLVERPLFSCVSLKCNVLCMSRHVNIPYALYIYTFMCIGVMQYAHYVFLWLPQCISVTAWRTESGKWPSLILTFKHSYISSYYCNVKDKYMRLIGRLRVMGYVVFVLTHAARMCYHRLYTRFQVL